MNKAVIFDIDNSLIEFSDRKQLLIEESVKAMIDAGLPGTFQELYKDFSEFYWKEGIEDQKIFEKYLLKKTGIIDYRVLAHAIIAYRKANLGLLRPFPGAKKVLIKLSQEGFKLGILSDAPKLEAHLRVCMLGLDDFFSEIVTGDDVGHLKPSKLGFIEVAKRLSVPLHNCFMLGDSIEKDIFGANSLGMVSIFASYGIPTRAWADKSHEAPRRNILITQEEYKPKYIIKDISELILIVLSHKFNS